MIRFSPNSLASIVNGSRSSSGSGSFGHLSASALSPGLGHPHLQQLQAHLLRTAGAGLLHSLPHTISPTASLFSVINPNQSGALSSTNKQQQIAGNSTQNIIDQPVSSKEVVAMVEADSASSSTSIVKKNRRSELYRHSSQIESSSDRYNPTSQNLEYHTVDTTDLKDEPGDFIETNCHWVDCHHEFNTQEELVKHINNDHIHTNKKSFICKWEDCSREEKPFKAQYMLVVHMRRHTGEKPHKCTVSEIYFIILPKKNITYTN